MMDYLARLKARCGQKHPPDEPPKPTKPLAGGSIIGFVGFDSDTGGPFSGKETRPETLAGSDARKRSATGRTDAHEERAALIEYDSGAPREWAEGFARLDRARLPDDVPQQRWLQFIDDCGMFLDGRWPAKAASLGWGAADLFGCDTHKPFARVDWLGLMWLLNGRRIVALTADSPAIMTSNGGRLTYRRVPNDPGRVLAWSLRGGGDR
jgi:hypothetical protein